MDPHTHTHTLTTISLVRAVLTVRVPVTPPRLIDAGPAEALVLTMAAVGLYTCGVVCKIDMSINVGCTCTYIILNRVRLCL